MPKIQIKGLPRQYNFVVNQMEFQCLVEWKAEEGVHPKDILIRDLEEVLQQLKDMPQFKLEESFKLPPLKDG